MTEVWIVNASPVITMAKAGYLQLFHQLAVDTVIPEAVAREIQKAPASDPARKILESGWGRRASPKKSLQRLSNGAWELANPPYWLLPPRGRVVRL